MKPLCFLLVLIVSGAAGAQTAVETDTTPLFEGIADIIQPTTGDYWTFTSHSEGAGVEEGAIRQLDVTQCVELALKQNPRVFIASEQSQEAAARAAQARAPWRPQVKASLGYSYVEGLSDTFGGFSFLGGAGDDFTRRDALSLSQTLYAGGRIRAAVDGTQALAHAAYFQARAVDRDLAFEAKQAFYDCLLAGAMVNVAEDSVSTFDHHLADARRTLEVGKVSNFEVLRAQTELGARKSALVATRNLEYLAYMNLLRILALPLDTHVRLIQYTPHDVQLEDVRALVDQAFENRPELKALASAEDAAQHNLRSARGRYKPRAAATLEWTNLDGGGSYTPDGWSATVGVEWDITVGGSRKHEFREAQAALEKTKFQLADAQTLVEFEVRQAYVRVLDAVAKIRSEKGTVKLAREARRLAALRFKEGFATQAEVLDAELALTNAETSFVQALRDYAVALAALDKAAGPEGLPE